MSLLPAAKISWKWKGKGLFASSWSVEHDEQGTQLCALHSSNFVFANTILTKEAPRVWAEWFSSSIVQLATWVQIPGEVGDWKFDLSLSFSWGGKKLLTKETIQISIIFMGIFLCHNFGTQATFAKLLQFWFQFFRNLIQWFDQHFCQQWTPSDSHYFISFVLSLLNFYCLSDLLLLWCRKWLMGWL